MPLTLEQARRLPNYLDEEEDGPVIHVRLARKNNDEATYTFHNPDFVPSPRIFYRGEDW